MLIEAQQATIDGLQAQLDQIKNASGEQSETITSQQQLIDKLRRELALLKRHIFGQRRERFVNDPRQQKQFEVDQQQLEQAVDSQVEPDEQLPSPRRGKGHGRRPLPDTSSSAIRTASGGSVPGSTGHSIVS